MNREDICIRPPTSGELGSLHELARGSGEVPQWSRSDYETLLTQTPGRKRKVLLAEARGAIAGFAVAANIVEASPGSPPAPPEWELEIILVSQDARRNGLGLRLLRQLVRHAERGVGGKMFLEVRQSNLAARSLYEKAGFTSCGLRRGYYHLPEEDAIIYQFLFAEKS